MTNLRLGIVFQRVDPSKGGAETYVADLCRALVARGHQVDLIAESWAEGALPEDVLCRRVETCGWTRLGRMRSFAERAEAFLARRSYDCTVGFINTWGQDVLIPQGGVQEASLESNAKRFAPGWRRSLYLAAKRANPRHALYRAIEARQYDLDEGARVVIAVSEMVRGHLARHQGVPRQRARVVPNAIDANRLHLDDPEGARARFRAELGLREDDLVALFVGHNFRLKGLPDLLHALHERVRRAPCARPIHLVACGRGKLAPMRRLVGRLGLGETVHLVGFLPDARIAYHASDFFVLPTYYDPCSLVVFEALACGLPVITTACNGAGEVITRGREGFVIAEPSDHPGLIEAMDRLCDDAARRAMSGHAARLGREQSFDRHVERLERVFEEVAAARYPVRFRPDTIRISA